MDVRFKAFLFVVLTTTVGLIVYQRGHRTAPGPELSSANTVQAAERQPASAPPIATVGAEATAPAEPVKIQTAAAPVEPPVVESKTRKTATTEHKHKNKKKKRRRYD